MEHRFHSTRKWRFDLAWPEHMIGVECDGAVYSGGRHVRGLGYSQDCEKLKADMQSPEIEEHIATSARLAEALGFNGTPSFVIGDQLIPGFVEKAQLTEVVSAARAIK